MGLMTSLKRVSKAEKQALSCSPQPDRCGGMSGSGISFSEHEMMRTQGFAVSRAKRLMAGKRMTLSTHTISGFTAARTAGRSFSAHSEVETIASQQSRT